MTMAMMNPYTITKYKQEDKCVNLKKHQFEEKSSWLLQWQNKAVLMLANKRHVSRELQIIYL